MESAFSALLQGAISSWLLKERNLPLEEHSFFPSYVLVATSYTFASKVEGSLESRLVGSLGHNAQLFLCPARMQISYKQNILPPYLLRHLAGTELWGHTSSATRRPYMPVLNLKHVAVAANRNLASAQYHGLINIFTCLSLDCINSSNAPSTPSSRGTLAVIILSRLFSLPSAVASITS